MWCLLPYLQVAGMDLGGSLEARGRRGLLPLGAFEQLHLWPQSLQGSANQKQKKKKKKKRALQQSTTCCSHCPGNTPTLQLPLPNTLGSTQIFDHCPFPRPYN